MKCPLCLSSKEFVNVSGPDKRRYTCCENCFLIFTDTRYHPSKKEEEKRYKQHKNGIQFPGYVKFLQQAIEPTLPFITKEMKGLDFGCGPEPTLNKLLEQEGYQCDVYDPIFFPDLPHEKYDYIIATECFEHFFLPARDLQKLNSLLKPGSILTVMTELWSGRSQFNKWYYAKDPTHVSFYNKRTMNFIANKFGYTIVSEELPRVTVMQKNLVEEENPVPENV
ncbi:MAG: class I SAM-dependent methyltransferase [Bacteroidia bacterium]